MPTTRTTSKDALYGEIKTHTLVEVPEPEPDIYVTRGLEWAIGGTILGAIAGGSWFVHRLFTPADGAAAVGGAVEFIVGPILFVLYALIGATVGACFGMAVGIVYMAIGANRESRESRESQESQEPRESRKDGAEAGKSWIPASIRAFRGSH